MPLKTQADVDASTAAATDVAYLVAGKKPCIGVQLVNRQNRTDGTYSPAHIKLIEHTNVSSGVCQQVRNSQVVTDYFNSRVPGAGDGNTPIDAAIPVGSSKGIYGAAPSS